MTKKLYVKTIIILLLINQLVLTDKLFSENKHNLINIQEFCKKQNFKEETNEWLTLKKILIQYNNWVSPPNSVITFYPNNKYKEIYGGASATTIPTHIGNWNINSKSYYFYFQHRYKNIKSYYYSYIIDSYIYYNEEKKKNIFGCNFIFSKIKNYKWPEELKYPEILSSEDFYILSPELK